MPGSLLPRGKLADARVVGGAFTKMRNGPSPFYSAWWSAVFWNQTPLDIIASSRSKRRSTHAGFHRTSPKFCRKAARMSKVRAMVATLARTSIMMNYNVRRAAHHSFVFGFNDLRLSHVQANRRRGSQFLARVPRGHFSRDLGEHFWNRF